MPLTGIGTAIGNIGGAGITAAANAKQAQLNRQFQERMSNTAHQRQVADMREAGLNPILSATGGSGASQPGGAQASMPDMSNMGSSIAQGSQSAAQAKIGRANAKVAKQEADIKTSAVGKEAHAYGMYIGMGIPPGEAKTLAAAHAVERHGSKIQKYAQQGWKMLRPKLESARHRASERKKYDAYVSGLPKSNPYKYKTKQKKRVYSPIMGPHPMPKPYYKNPNQDPNSWVWKGWDD